VESFIVLYPAAMNSRDCAAPLLSRSKARGGGYPADRRPLHIINRPWR